MTDIRFTARELAAFGGLFLILIVALGVAPFHVSTRQDVSSVASALGYNGSVAYFLLVAVSFLWIATFLFLRKTPWLPTEVREWSAPQPPGVARRVVEIAIVVAVALFLYWPSFLARYGPYIEDNLYLSLLHRMHGGQNPYVDFEFLYGPLLIYPQHWWLKTFGFSMKSYYAFQAAAEAFTYGLLLWNTQRWFPDSRKRITIFALVSVFLINTVLGMNYNGLRRLLPALGLIALAVRPGSWKILGGVSVLFGVLLAYSHEMASAALAASTVLYLLIWHSDRDRSHLLRILVLWGIASGVWFLLLKLVLGQNLGAYISATTQILQRFTAGEQAFPFRWSLNSICAFALLGLACSLVGRGLRAGKAPLLAGDRLLVAALIYALVGLRAGLNRSDIWHLTPPMLPLIFAFLLPFPRRLFAYSDSIRRLTTTTIVVLAATYLISLAPFGSFYANGLYRGFRDSLGGAQTGPAPHTRAPSVEHERTRPDPAILELGVYLANPENRSKPVLFYSRLWSLDKRAGVYGSVHLPDDFFMTDESGHDIAEFVRQQRPIVVIQEPVYRRLFDAIDTGEYEKYLDRQPMTLTKAVISWLSTPFFKDLPVEWKLKEDRWQSTVAPSLSNYKQVTAFGPYVVMMPQ